MHDSATFLLLMLLQSLLLVNRQTAHKANSYLILRTTRKGMESTYVLGKAFIAMIELLLKEEAWWYYLCYTQRWGSSPVISIRPYFRFYPFLTALSMVFGLSAPGALKKRYVGYNTKLRRRLVCTVIRY